jgi:hypothetical protein
MAPSLLGRESAYDIEVDAEIIKGLQKTYRAWVSLTDDTHMILLSLAETLLGCRDA